MREIAIAIVFAGLMIGGGLAIAGRYDMRVVSSGLYVEDRWRGTVHACLTGAPAYCEVVYPAASRKGP